MRACRKDREVELRGSAVAHKPSKKKTLIASRGTFNRPTEWLSLPLALKILDAVRDLAHRRLGAR